MEPAKMPNHWLIRWTIASVFLSHLAGCAAPGSVSPAQRSGTDRAETDDTAANRLNILNRISWGFNFSSWRQAEALGMDRYLQRQLHPTPAVLPGAVQAQIAEMTITQQPLVRLTESIELSRKAADANTSDELK